MHERWTRAVLRRQPFVVAAWLLVLAVGVLASVRLPDLSSNSFSVPGTDSERAQLILERSFDERPDGTFTVVFEVERSSDKATQSAIERRLERAAPTLPGGRTRAHRTTDTWLGAHAADRVMRSGGRDHDRARRV